MSLRRRIASERRLSTTASAAMYSPSGEILTLDYWI